MENLENGVKSKSAEIRAALKDQLASGQPVVFHINDPKEGKDGEVYAQVFVAQSRKGLGTSASSAQQMFLGWGDRLVRCSINTKPSVFEFEVGSVLEGFVITSKQVVGTPQWEKQKPVLKGDKMMVVDGKPVYEHTALMSTEEYAEANRKATEFVTALDSETNTEKREYLAEQAYLVLPDYKFDAAEYELHEYHEELDLSGEV